MNLLTILLVLLGTLTSATAQLLLKAGTNTLANSPKSSSISSLFFNVLTQPYILIGVFCYVASMAIWLLVLSRLPVSVAYPMLSIGYIFTALFGYLLFGEQLGWSKILGILIIIIGVVVLTSSKN